MALMHLKSQPGVRRDGTRLDGNFYLDAQWARFQRGLVRKMGGYREVTDRMDEKVYGLNSFSVNATQYMHLGSESLLMQRLINNSGVQIAANDRTPGGLVASADNIWQLEAIFDLNEQDTVLVAHAAPNMDIASDDAQPIWYGVLTDSGLLVTTGSDPVSGGIVRVGQYLISFGSGGQLQYNETANNVTAAFQEEFVTDQKIVRGLPVRGAGVPAGLLWSLDSLLLMSLNTGTGPFWRFDTVGEISVLSSRGIIEYDGIYYWPGVDRFLAYNGVIREIPNQMNVNWFFDGLNFSQRQKVFAYKVPRFGEIWWCYPRGSATECTHAVVLNVRENTWYDTELTDGGRTDGLYAKVYFKPFMTGSEVGDFGYSLWQHETGVNKVPIIGDEQPIPAHFETHEIALVTASEPEDSVLRVSTVEPDFIQEGDLTMTVKGRANARAAVLSDDPVTITEQETPPAGVDVEQQLARTKRSHRLMSFRFDSNTLDGDFQMGHLIAHVDKSGSRQTQ